MRRAGGPRRATDACPSTPCADTQPRAHCYSTHRVEAHQATKASMGCRVCLLAVPNQLPSFPILGAKGQVPCSHTRIALDGRTDQTLTEGELCARQPCLVRTALVVCEWHAIELHEPRMAHVHEIYHSNYPTSSRLTRSHQARSFLTCARDRPLSQGFASAHGRDNVMARRVRGGGGRALCSEQ